MSKIAKTPIVVPANVVVSIEHNNILVKGPKGDLSYVFNSMVNITIEDGHQKILHFTPASKDGNAWAQCGTARALVNNMVKGVTEGFQRTLELVGVGYRAQMMDNNTLSLSLGFSHSIEYKPVAGIRIETPNNTTVVLHGIDHQA